MGEPAPNALDGAGAPELARLDWSFVTVMWNMTPPRVPPRDPNEEEDDDDAEDEEDGEPDDEIEPAVIREPDE